MLKSRSPKRENIISNESKEKERLNMDMFRIGLLVIGNVFLYFSNLLTTIYKNSFFKISPPIGTAKGAKEMDSKNFELFKCTQKGLKYKTSSYQL